MASIRQYFSIAASANASWLASGEFVYLSTESGVNQIWKADPRTGQTRQLTFFQERIFHMSVSPDGRQVFFTMDAGANDPRVPVEEAEQIVDSLRSRGVPVEYLCYGDEGHGLSKRKNQLDCYPQVAEFLKKYLTSGKGKRG